MANSTAVDPWESVACSIRHADVYPCRAEWSIEPEVMTQHCVFYIQKGSGWVEIDGRRMDARLGDLFILRLTQRVAAGHDPRRPVTVLSIGFSLRGASNHDALRPFRLPDRMRLTKSSMRRLEFLYDGVIGAFRETAYHGSLASRGALMTLVAEVLRMAEALPASRRIDGPAPNPGPASRVADIQAFIDANLAKAHGLDSLARRASLSPSHFASVFRRETGQPPMVYVRARRIARAKSMLAGSDETVARIAQAVGFEDPYHFSRVFSRIEGVSPRAYRASMKHPFFP